MEQKGPFRQVAPDQIEVREGGGCASLFGLPFLAAGIFVALVGSRIVPADNPQDVPEWGWPLIVLMGLVFTGVGAGLVFGRRWILIDKTLGKISKRWGLLIPFKHQDHYLHEYDAVLIRFDAGDSETSDHFPVLLRGKHGADDLPLTNPLTYGESRQGAAQLARLLRIPIVDSTTDHDTVIQTEDVGDTFRERLETANDPLERVPKPLKLKSHIENREGSVQIDIPGPEFRPASLLGIIIPAAILLLVVPHLSEFFRETDTPRYVRLFFLGFAVFLFGVLPVFSAVKGIIHAIRSRTRVTASSAEIVIQEQGAFRTQETRMSSEDIFGLDFGTVDSTLASAKAKSHERYGGATGPGTGGSRFSSKWLKWIARMAKSKGIIVKSERGFFTFGAGLPDDEVRYLYSLVKAVISGKVASQSA